MYGSETMSHSVVKGGWEIQDMEERVEVEAIGRGVRGLRMGCAEMREMEKIKADNVNIVDVLGVSMCANEASVQSTEVR